MTKPKSCTRSNSESDRAKIWQAARKYKGAFSVQDIQILCNTVQTNTYDYLNALMRAGYIRKVGRKKIGPNQGNFYIFIKDTGPKHLVAKKCLHIYYDQNTGEVFSDKFNETEMEKELAKMKKPVAQCKVPTYTNTQKSKIWDYVRAKERTFTLQDVEQAINKDTPSIYDYLCDLLRMKYIKKLTNGSYVLVKDTGPKNPVALACNKSIFNDPNLPEGKQIFSYKYTEKEIVQIREHYRNTMRFRDAKD